MRRGSEQPTDATIDRGRSDRVMLAVGAVLSVVIVAMSLTPELMKDTRAYDLVAAAVLLLAYVPLAFAKRRPVAMLVLVQVANSIWFIREYPGALTAPAMLVAIYFVTVTGDRRRAAVALVIVVAPVTIGVMLASEVDSLTTAAGIVGWMLAAALLGEAVHQRRALEAQLARQAEAAAAEQRAEMERRVGEERLRIARDLHDVLAHTVTAMSIQAGVAADAIETDPELARRSLAELRQEARSAVDDVRRSITTLRNGADTTVEPVPGLNAIDALLDQAGRRGLAVTGQVDQAAGDGAPLPEIVDVSAYRIVQEALTNIQRHSLATTAEVTVRRTGEDLEIRVVDPGPARNEVDAVGFGLIGMEERAGAVGGTISRRRTDEGGFEVEARLPLAHPVR